MWSWLWRHGEVDEYTTTEPDVRALVCAKGEWSHNDLYILDFDGLYEGQDAISIVCDGGQRLGYVLLCVIWFRHLLVLLSAFLAFTPSFAPSVMERAKIFRSSPSSNSSWRIVASMRNGGKKTALSGIQSLCLFKCARSPVSERRRTSAIGRRILSPSAAKVISILAEIIEGELRSPDTEKPQQIPPVTCFQQSCGQTLTGLRLVWRSW